MKSTLNPNVLYNWKQKFIKGDKLHSQVPIKIIQQGFGNRKWNPREIIAEQIISKDAYKKDSNQEEEEERLGLVKTIAKINDGMSLRKALAYSGFRKNT